MSFQCLNQDGVEIELDISFQYRVISKNLAAIVKQFRDEDGFERMGESLGIEKCSSVPHFWKKL